MSARNIIDKIFDSHLILQKTNQPAIVAIDLVLLHEVTSFGAFKILADRKLPIYAPNRCIATPDHSVPTRLDRFRFTATGTKEQVEHLKEMSQQHHLRYYGFNSGHHGILHVISPELGATQPGMTIICGDSHTSTHGAFGAFAFGVGSTMLGQALATGCLLLDKPKTMKVEFKGRLPKGVFPKDMILKLISILGMSGGTGYFIEYTGDAIRSLTMEERMTICNMSIECGARGGLIAPDETTFAYLKNRAYAPSSDKWEEALTYWKTLSSDKGCAYDKEIDIQVDTLEPMVTWGTNVGQGTEISAQIPLLSSYEDENKKKSAEAALQYIGLTEGQPMAGLPIDYAFIGSCTNSRIEDLRIAAKILKDNQVHPNVKMLVVPGSEAVLSQAIQEGLNTIFSKAGADFRLPGCSACCGLNDDKIPPGKRCLSSSNRNFVGRQGPGSRTHLASPATVAASAIAGKIISPEKYLN